MISALFAKDQRGFIRSFEFSGHSGYAEAGQDIVCAGMSTLAQSIIGTLDELLGEAFFSYEIDADKGLIRCRLCHYEKLSREEQIQAKTLMFAAYIGAKQAEEAYSSYIKTRWLQAEAAEDTEA